MIFGIVFACTAFVGLSANVRSADQITYGGEIQYQGDFPDVVVNPTDFGHLPLPASWDWRTLGLMTTDLNQHIPQYCGSCWAHASMSTIADRIKIANKGMKRDSIPSVQVLLNCGTAGSCGGGDIHAAFRWIYQVGGIPDVTCMQYQATGNHAKSCAPIDICRNCDPSGECYAVEKYPKITISEYGRVFGDENIQREIMNRGPVACMLNSDCIHTYSGGVSPYNETSTGEECKPYHFNHAIQLSGWGTDENGKDFWIGRNSWGTYWGEDGFFRIIKGGNYNPVMCYWAVPNV